LALSDFPRNFGSADDSAVFVPNWRNRDGDINDPAVLPQSLRFVVFNTFSTTKTFENPWFFIGMIGWDQFRNRLADHLVGPVSKNLLGALIPTVTIPLRVLLMMASSA